MPSVKDALKAVFQKNSSKIQDLAKEVENLHKAINDRQMDKAYKEVEIKNGEHPTLEGRNAAIKNMRNIQEQIDDKFKEANEVLKKIERLGGAEKAGELRNKLNQLGDGKNANAFKQQARGPAL